MNIDENELCKDPVCLMVENIVKVYPGTTALKDVSFKVRTGKVNVLVGENGAGKSTLMKILAGIEKPTSGRIIINGEEVKFKDTIEAEKKGIGIIHQELNLFPNLNIVQNMFMGAEKIKYKILLDPKAHMEKCKEILNRLQHPLDPNTRMGDLRVGQQQVIEIARHLNQENLKVLIMDEPTSSLSAAEVSILFKLIRELKNNGISIIYISHRLEEIMGIGDYITVLRDGSKVAEDKIANVDMKWMISNMVGTDKGFNSLQRKKKSIGDTILEVDNLNLPKPNGGYILNDVSFKLKKGEILGVYGLMGAGRTELIECIMGLRPEYTGEIKIRGVISRSKDIARQIENGFAMVPEDRQCDGIVQNLSICKNISLSNLGKYMKYGWLNRKQENADVDKMIADIHIKTSDKTLPIMSLSGGNQQKVVIGKGLLTTPKIFLMDEPSRGIDVAAKAEVYEIISKLAESGISIIVVSSELQEITLISDRIIVLSNGKITGEFSDDEISEQSLVEASYRGHTPYKTTV
jgi:erythritol transport system ATP-binding protein